MKYIRLRPAACIRGRQISISAGVAIMLKFALETAISSAWAASCKGGYPMRRFLLEILAQIIASIIAAVAIHKLGLK